MTALSNGARQLLAVVGVLLCVTTLSSCGSPALTRVAAGREGAGHSAAGGVGSAVGTPRSDAARGRPTPATSDPAGQPSESTDVAAQGTATGTAGRAAGSSGATPRNRATAGGAGTGTGATGTARTHTSRPSAGGPSTASSSSSGVRESGSASSPGRVVVREGEVTVGGLVRQYTLVLPPGASADRPVRTLLVLHGWHNSGHRFAQDSGIEAAALARGVAVLEPDGYAHSWDAGRCCGTTAASGIDDVATLRAVLAAAGADGVANTARPYVVGFSNGGMMTYRWLCSGGAARAAAVLNGSLMAPCSGAARVPVLHVSGLADQTVPTDGIASSAYLGTSVMSAQDSLTTATGCATLSAVTGPAPAVHALSGCGGRVRLLTVAGLGHVLRTVGGFSPGPYAVSWVLRQG
ncbi:MAG: alpha/beta hydrolase family esterase [Actinomycetes bacterium]